MSSSNRGSLTAMELLDELWDERNESGLIRSTPVTEVLKKLLEEKASSDKLFMEEEARLKEEKAKLKEKKASSDKLFMDNIMTVIGVMHGDLETIESALDDVLCGNPV